MTIGLVMSFGLAMVTPMFMDEINLYTTLISIKGYSICAIHASY